LPKLEFVGVAARPEVLIRLFCTAFGFAWNSLVSEGAKWVERSKQKAKE